MTKKGAIEREYQGRPWGLTDLTVLTAGRHEPPKFPIDVLGPFWGPWATRQAKAKSAPVDYVACALLAIAASLIGNSRNGSPRPGWTVPPIIWMSLVGGPSSGKSPALDAPLGMIRVLEEEMGVDYPETLRQWESGSEAAKVKRDLWEGEVKTAVKRGAAPPDIPLDASQAEKPVMPRLSISDTTPEALGRLMSAHPKGLLCYRDELSGLLGNFDRYGGDGERAMWLEAYGAGFYIIDRIKHGEPVRIPHLSVSIIGGIQPDRLLSTLLKGDDDGMAARFLYCWPDPVRPNQSRDIFDDGAALRALRHLRNLRMGEDEYGKPRPVTVRFSKNADDLLYAFEDSNFEEGSAASGFYAGHIGKMPGMVARLALVLTYLHLCADGIPEPEEIGQKAVGFAAHLVDDYFKPMAKRAFGDAALPEADRHAATIARRIVKERLTVINASEIRRKWKLPGLREAPKIKAALHVLEEANCIRPSPSREGGSPGRQTSNYEVSPNLLEASS